MIYAFSISTPANTPATSKLATTLKIEKGIITGFFVNFPSGSAGLLHAQVFREYSQIFPKSQGDFHGDNRYFSFTRLAYPILFLPYEIYAHTWNTSTKYSHQVDIQITIDESGAII